MLFIIVSASVCHKTAILCRQIDKKHPDTFSFVLPILIEAIIYNYKIVQITLIRYYFLYKKSQLKNSLNLIQEHFFGKYMAG